jgi:putative ABC transport system permease protein
VAAFVVGEAAVVVLLGLVTGALLGSTLARVLVAVLAGVFDPPPSSLAVPWTYLGLVAVAVTGSIAVASAAVLRWAGRGDVATLREA